MRTCPMWGNYSADKMSGLILASMTKPTTSTWPEAAYALALTKPGNWPAQRAVMELFSAHAWAQGVFVGPVVCSNRDLASHLFRSSAAGHSGASRLLHELCERGVLREIAHGSGTAPSEYDVAHWTRWDVPWRVREGTIIDRMVAFVMGEIRTQAPISGHVMVRALAKSARMFSADLDDLATSSIDVTASGLTLFQSHQVSDEQCDRYAAPHTVLPLGRKTPSLESERDEQAREAPAELVQVFIDGCERTTWLARSYKLELGRLVDLAGEGGLATVIALAGSPLGPGGIKERLAWLRINIEAPTRALVRERPEISRAKGNLRALEMTGDGDSVEAHALRERLGTLES